MNIYSLIEYGKLTPVGMKCFDRKIRARDFIKKNSVEEKLLTKLYNGVDKYTENEIKILESLDGKLDIPFIEAMIKPSYFSLKRLICGECKRIPKRFNSIKYYRDAASFCDLDTLKYGTSKGVTYDETVAIKCISSPSNNSLECLKYIISNGNIRHGINLCNSAALHGKLEHLEYLKELGFVWGYNTCIYAIMNDNVNCLAFAYENDCPCDEIECTTTAASYGSYNCLKYMCEKGLETSELTTAYAAKYGNLECLKYLRDINCEWDKLTTEYAAMNGQLECLIFACENGCTYDLYLAERAKEKGHNGCYEYLMSLVLV